MLKTISTGLTAASFGAYALIATGAVLGAATPAAAFQRAGDVCYVIDIVCDRQGNCTVSDAQLAPDCDGNPG